MNSDCDACDRGQTAVLVTRDWDSTQTWVHSQRCKDGWGYFPCRNRLEDEIATGGVD